MVIAQDGTIVTAIYILVLILIMIFDLRQRRILNSLTLPATILALAVSLAQGQQVFYLTLLGALIGLLFFYVLYLIGNRLYGSGALGLGDVKLAMLLGAMLGLRQIMFTLALGLLFAGFAAVVLLFVSRRFRLRSTLPYGVFLSLAGMVMLIWDMV